MYRDTQRTLSRIHYLSAKRKQDIKQSQREQYRLTYLGSNGQSERTQRTRLNRTLELESLVQNNSTKLAKTVRTNKRELIPLKPQSLRFEFGNSRSPSPISK